MRCKLKFRTKVKKSEISGIILGYFESWINRGIAGFDVVELATFPREVVEEARKIATKLRSESDATSIIGDDSRHDRNLLRLANKLRSVLPILEASKEDACAKYFINLREKA